MVVTFSSHSGFSKNWSCRVFGLETLLLAWTLHILQRPVRAYGPWVFSLADGLSKILTMMNSKLMTAVWYYLFIFGSTVLGYPVLEKNLNVEPQFPWTFPGVIIFDFIAIFTLLEYMPMYFEAWRIANRGRDPRPYIKRWYITDSSSSLRWVTAELECKVFARILQSKTFRLFNWYSNDVWRFRSLWIIDGHRMVMWPVPLNSNLGERHGINWNGYLSIITFAPGLWSCLVFWWQDFDVCALTDALHIASLASKILPPWPWKDACIFLWHAWDVDVKWLHSWLVLGYVFQGSKQSPLPTWKMAWSSKDRSLKNESSGRWWSSLIKLQGVPSEIWRPNKHSAHLGKRANSRILLTVPALSLFFSFSPLQFSVRLLQKSQYIYINYACDTI